MTITQQGWTTWHRVIGNDCAQGAADAKYLQDTAGAKKIFVIDDDQDYGKGLAGFVKTELGSPWPASDTVQPARPTSRDRHQGHGSGADAVFYGGYYAEAGLLAKQLRQAGFKGLFMSGDGSEDPAFVKVRRCRRPPTVRSCRLLRVRPRPTSTRKYKAVNGNDSGLYSTQSYDATNIFLAGIDDGKTQPRGHERLHRRLHRDGVSGPIAFDDKGDIKESTIYAYKVKDGKLDTANPTPIK